jgi:alpha-2-macroglobulin
MQGRQRACILGVALLGCVIASWLSAANKAVPQTRENLVRAYQAGNYKDAYEGLRKLALDPTDDPVKVSQDLNMGVNCLANLGRIDEADAFREGVIAAHARNWRLLQTAAQSYINTQHYGFIVAGKFYRGHKRGGGRYVNTMPRDRARAFQLMQQALPLTANEKNRADVGQFQFNFAHMILQGAGWHDAWRLQYLTDLSKLPDYEDAYRYYGYSGHFAPVDEKGNPVLHRAPKSYQDAASDGERWRWLLTESAKENPSLVNDADMVFARFLNSQFGVQTMAGFGRIQADEDQKDTGTFALHTLKDEETIARLANGVKRFSLPDEFNWIKVCERVARRGNSHEGAQARDMIAQGYENRRQYVKAAEAWKRAIKEYGGGNNRSQRLEQIVGNWGRFEPIATQATGTKPTVDFRFRNGDKVTFEAHTIKVDKLLDDVKAYLKGNPARLDWNQLQIGNIGYRLVQQNQQQYVGEKAAGWELPLKPRPKHVDDRVTVTVPLEKPGAYLVTAQMPGGNLSRIIVWVADTAIVKKQLEGKVFYFLADAATGAPVDKANMEFFGWKQEQVAPGRNQYRVNVKSFTAKSDRDGQLILGQDSLNNRYSWLITARKAKAGPGGSDRMAYLGFTSVWFGRRYDPEYNQTKTFVITDRPVYRPNQTVQFKAWVRHAQYDQKDVSQFAGQTFTVRIHNPRGDKVYEKALTADEYGGIAGEFPVPTGTMLGSYGLQVLNHGGGSFRVEEYKKPEFEVTVEAPKEPVRLGETVNATVKAKYYFGAPVTSAKVKYKVLRTAHTAQWYPHGVWDWFYGAGYWWFAGDYSWYPGWAEWRGCMRPIPPWWGRRHEQPEVVLENEVPIGPDGTVQIAIDTAPAKALHGDQDHQYAITAEVVDESRRMIVGTGNVLVARKPFKVFSWVDRGHYRAGDTVKAQFKAQTLDGKPVEGKGTLTLYQISYKKGRPVETAVQNWDLDTNVEGRANQQMKAAKAGQYRISYKVTDNKKHTIEGGYLFTVRGTGFTGEDYHFSAIELIPDRREYAPGETVKLMINNDQSDGTVLLFVKPTNGVYLAPQVLRLKGKSTEEQVAVIQRDMPNFFVEALTVHGGKVHTDVREIVVPPEKRVLNVEVLPSQKEYKPGQKASVKVKVTDFDGKPFVGSLALSVYDRSVEYIAGGSNVPEIREFFWKWRRHHYPQTESSLNRSFGNLLHSGEIGMSDLGVFGGSVVEELAAQSGARNQDKGKDAKPEEGKAPPAPAGPGGGFGGAPGKKDGASRRAQADAEKPGRGGQQEKQGQPDQPPMGGQEPAVRKNFADTAFWAAALTTNKKGVAEVDFTMPENLTGWKVKVWGMGHGTRVGQGEAEVVTKKDLLVRLQAPRFFVQKDEVVLSANVHNYLKSEKEVKVTLEVGGGTLSLMGDALHTVKIPAKGEKRVDWRVKVTAEGSAIVRMKAISDEESDAMEMRFPCHVHGMLKTDSFSGVVRPDKEVSRIDVLVPQDRRVADSRLEVRVSPSLAGAMVDALPYMVDYPYGCTEQTLNRFLPTVITQKILLEMKLDLKAIEQKRTNLNTQEIGDAKDRAKQWKRFPRNPVFDVAEVHKISSAGVQALINMQLADGGWGWFSGFGEHSYPHTTALVVHGLQLARANGLGIQPGVIEKGLAWLKSYQAEQVRRIQNAPAKIVPWKDHADNIDALVFMVLADENSVSKEMREFLYRDRTKLSVYAKAMYGLALHKQNEGEKLAMILKNIEQFVVHDNENQSAYLRLPGDNPWWYWYGSEIEADAYYLKLLSKTDPRGKTAPGLVKYLLNNRKHATYWNSTRDTAICIEAMADYIRASGEDKPDMTIEVWLDDKKMKEVKVDSSNLFTFDNVLILTGEKVRSGKHSVEVRKKGTGPVYFNAYVTNFTLEDPITRAGLEVKVNRKYYKLTRVDKKVKVPGSRGQAADRKVEKYERTELANLAELKSGDLVEIELEIDSKNDYEYLLFEDPKAAGFEPLLVRSGYNPNDMGAYMELRDDRVCFFVRWLARGKHSVSYRMRAEIPGKFSALPTRASAMYAPELRGNSDEIKLVIKD